MGTSNDQTTAIETPVREYFLPFNRPDISEEEIQAVVDTLRSGWLTTGPKAKQFEEMFAHYVGVKYAVATNSCTGGLHVALAAAGIGAGHEVIVPTMTFAATANVVVHQGARPVLVDVCPDTLNIDPAAVDRAITPRTRAIIPVHLFGHPCDMDTLQDIAARNRLLIIEDAAHAVGAKWRGQMIGSIGDATVFSFYATKNLVTGEGGMITTDDQDYADEMRRWVLHGMSRDAWDRYTEHGSWYYEIVLPGFKYNLTDIQAALGLGQLARIESMTARRAEIAAMYDLGLGDLPALQLPVVRAGIRHAHHLYAIRLNLDQLAINRDVFIQQLHREGIGTSVHFIPLHRHPYFQTQWKARPADFPIADEAYHRLITLPLYTRMSNRDAQDVITAVERVVERWAS